MTAPRNRRKGFRIERNPGMKVALTALSLVGFAVGWMGFAHGGHPGDNASTATATDESPTAPMTPVPDVQSNGFGVQSGQAQPTPSYSVPAYRTSRGS